MKRSLYVVVGALVAVVVAATTALGVLAVAEGDRSPMARGPAMMTPGAQSTPQRPDDPWGSMSMHGTPMGSESDFLVEMVAHHQEAVAAARELTRSDRAAMRAFGESIVRTQSEQIEQMRTWLREWYSERPSEPAYRPMMRDLSGLSGDRLDEVFLQDMIGHHMAAVMMSQQLLGRGADHDEVAALARSIRDEQHAEIIQMQRWLSRWFGVRWQGGMGCPTGAGGGMGQMW